MIIRPKPFRGDLLHLPYAVKNVQIKPFMPDRSIVALDIGVLLRLAGLDVVLSDSSSFGPFGED